MPAAVLAGVLVLRGDGRGYLVGFPLLALIVMLVPAISAQTWFPLSAGVVLTPPEIVGPVGSFLVLGLVALWALVVILRRLPRAG